jgi:hypothetical protein
MIVNLQNQANRVYFNGILPKYNTYTMRLVSRYSNKEIDNDEFGVINLTDLEQGEGWFSFTYDTDITSLQTKELNEYYDCILEGVDINDSVFYTKEPL